MAYAFADFELDTERAELRRSGKPVRVEPQVFDLLTLLIAGHTRMVSKDEIFDAIWGNKIVSDAVLSSRIKDARKAIGDDGKRQRFIATIPRRGFRFIGDVVKTQDHMPTRAAGFSRPVVAVRLFSGPPADEDFQPTATGVCNALSSALAAWRLFAVAPPESSFQNDRLNGARYIVEGALRSSAKTLQIEVSLTDAELGLIRDEWTSARSNSVRVANITDGSGSADRVNGSAFISAATSQTDNDRDRLFGQSSLDAFFASLNDRTFRRRNESLFEI